jgi:saccharopine dehydrogenase-like NADP-dependent oxidoreductase
MRGDAGSASPGTRMKQILVLGAGKSAPCLIHDLLDGAAAGRWRLTVADLDPRAAEEAVGGRPGGRATAFDIHDPLQIRREFAGADLVVSMLAPAFQGPVAEACLEHGCHLVTVSYTDARLRALHDRAGERGLLFLGELGLDPGIDLMSAAQMLRRIRGEGGRVRAFRSYGGGVPAPESIDNPFRYAITWNPGNIARAGAAGALYREGGRTLAVPAHRVFEHTWPVEVAGLGRMEAYPNRDSLEYLSTFHLEDVGTMIRATLRWPGFAETWQPLVRLGLTDDRLRLPGLQGRCWRELTEMFLPPTTAGADLPARLACLLGLSPTGGILERLAWLGLFSERPLDPDAHTAAAQLTRLLVDKLVLAPGARDLVTLVHEFEVEDPAGGRYRHEATLVQRGEAGGFTAMARTVGLPAAIAARLILEERITCRGVAIPVLPEIYEPILAELAAVGIAFEEAVHPLPADRG